jgi:hypothetical protein
MGIAAKAPRSVVFDARFSLIIEYRDILGSKPILTEHVAIQLRRTSAGGHPCDFVLRLQHFMCAEELHHRRTSTPPSP